MAEKEDHLASARAKLAAGDEAGAFAALRTLMSWPGDVDDRSRLAEAATLLSRIAARTAGPEISKAIAAIAASPDDPKTLYDAGYTLYEARLPAVAATMLARANRFAPGQPAIVAELSSALEASLLYGPAALFLAQSGLPDRDPICAYLLGFTSSMAGDLDEARKRVAQIRGSTDSTVSAMHAALAGIVARSAALLAAGIPLDDRALVAWQAAIDGTVLLHESPHGHPDPMRGRYAYVADSPALMREGLERLRAVLGAASIAPASIVAAPDRGAASSPARRRRRSACPSRGGRAAPRAGSSSSGASITPATPRSSRRCGSTLRTRSSSRTRPGGWIRSHMRPT
jgi:hypothetical protein